MDNSKRKLFRDEQFDGGDGKLVAAMLKILSAVVIPVISMVFLFVAITKSADGRVQPNTWQAWAMLCVLVIGSFSTVFGMMLVGKYNFYGSKFQYYVWDFETGLYDANLANDGLLAYVKKKTSTEDKFSLRLLPLHLLYSFTYVLVILFFGGARVPVRTLMKLQEGLKANEKSHFIEELLLSDQYERYGRQIVSVNQIKHFSKGVQVKFTTTRYGAVYEENRIIYKEMPNYEFLLAKFQELYESKADKSELSQGQIKMLRTAIFIRMCKLVVTGVLAVVLIYLYTQLRLDALGSALEADGNDYYAFEWYFKRSANRSGIRIMQIIYFFITAILVVIVKHLLDIVAVKKFSCVPVKVEMFYESERKFYNKWFDEFRYFARVKYEERILHIGVPWNSWKNKDKGQALLVFRRNKPYCVIVDEW